MQKTILCLFAGVLSGWTALAQPDVTQSGIRLPDTTPFPVKTGDGESRFAGGVDKSKVMDFFQDQEFEAALAYLSPVLQADSDNLPVLNYAGYAYYMNENEGAALACYRRMLGVDSNSVTALHYLVLLQQNNDPAAALDEALKLVALQPAKAVSWRTAGELWERGQHPDSALVYLGHAYELAPGDPKNAAALGEALIETKDYTQADSIVDIALAGKDSLNVSLLKLRVRGAYLDKHYDEVLTPGERLLRLQEPAVGSLEWLALSYYDLKQYPDCIRVCEDMLDMGMELEPVYYYEARAQAKLKNYAGSDTLLRKALSKAISPTAEWYYDDLGDNFESQKEYHKAIAHYDTAFYLFKDPLTLYACGRIAETELHNNTLARGYYRHYLALARPQTAEEKKAYGYVRRRWGVHK
jgi:tetratricopeptide (TPR) repeat protein